MRSKLSYLAAGLLLLALPVGAAQVCEFYKTGLRNGTVGPFEWAGGDARVEIYGDWGTTGTATIQYSSNGKNGTYLDVEVADLVGATADVRGIAMEMGKGWWFKLVVASGDGTERLTFAVAAVEAGCR